MIPATRLESVKGLLYSVGRRKPHLQALGPVVLFPNLGTQASVRRAGTGEALFPSPAVWPREFPDRAHPGMEA